MCAWRNDKCALTSDSLSNKLLLVEYLLGPIFKWIAADSGKLLEKWGSSKKIVGQSPKKNCQDALSAEGPGLKSSEASKAHMLEYKCPKPLGYKNAHNLLDIWHLGRKFCHLCPPPFLNTPLIDKISFFYRPKCVCLLYFQPSMFRTENPFWEYWMFTLAFLGAKLLHEPVCPLKNNVH